MSRFHLAPSATIFNLDEISLLRRRDDGDYDIGWSGIALADHIDVADGESLFIALANPPTPVELTPVEVSLLGHQTLIGRMDWSLRGSRSFDLIEPDGAVVHVSSNAVYTIRQTTDPSSQTSFDPALPEALAYALSDDRLWEPGTPLQSFIGWDSSGECYGTINAPTSELALKRAPNCTRIIVKSTATPEEIYQCETADMPF